MGCLGIREINQHLLDPVDEKAAHRRKRWRLVGAALSLALPMLCALSPLARARLPSGA
jgi:hypothetical protein